MSAGKDLPPSVAQVRANEQIRAETEATLEFIIAFMRGLGVRVVDRPPALFSRLREAIARGFDAGIELSAGKETAHSKRQENESGPWSEDAKTPVRRHLKKAPQRARAERSGSSRPQGHRR